MPTFRSMKDLILLIRKHLDSYVTIKMNQSNIKFEESDTTNIDSHNNNDNKINKSNIHSHLLKKQTNPQYGIFEIGQLKHYIHEFNTLSTATSLMGDKLDSFYSYDLIKKQSNIKCLHCDFQKDVFSQQKSSSKSVCSKIILQHLVNEHPFISNYNYGHIITRRAVRQIRLQDIGEMAKATHIQRIYVVDRSCSLYFHHAINNIEPSMAVQVLYFEQNSHSNCEFMRGGNSKEILLLLGLLIQQIVVSLGKKVTIYTNESKCRIVEDFCKYYSIDGVTAVAGKGRKQTREQLNFNKIDYSNIKSQSFPKIQFASTRSQKLLIAKRRGFVKIQEDTDQQMTIYKTINVNNLIIRIHLQLNSYKIRQAGNILLQGSYQLLTLPRLLLQELLIFYIFIQTSQFLHLLGLGEGEEVVQIQEAAFWTFQSTSLALPLHLSSKTQFMLYRYLFLQKLTPSPSPSLVSDRSVQLTYSRAC